MLAIIIGTPRNSCKWNISEVFPFIFTFFSTPVWLGAWNCPAMTFCSTGLLIWGTQRSNSLYHPSQGVKLKNIVLMCRMLIQMHGIMDSIKYQQIKNLNLTACYKYYNGPCLDLPPGQQSKTNIKINTKMGHWAQTESFTMAVPVLWPKP